MAEPAPRGAHRLSQPGERQTEGVAVKLRRWTRGRPLIVESGSGRRPEVALTFDDGPSRWTGEIAVLLERNGCRGTFFVRGPAVQERPETLAALALAGHEIGSHLWSHADAASQSRDEIRDEIGRSADAIHAVIGRRPTLLRPPYCRAPQLVAEAASRAGVKMVVQRSIASEDWAAAAPEDIFEPVLEIALAGDIVGLHDGISPDERDSDSREVTVAAVSRLVPGLLERNLQPVTVSQLLR